MELRVGIAGFGKIGKIRSIEIEKFSNAELVAVYDLEKPSKEDTQKFKFCSTFEELLSQNLDAIFTCTYNNVLAEYTKTALSKGIHK